MNSLEASQISPTTRNRRQFRFSLAGLFLLTTFLLLSFTASHYKGLRHELKNVTAAEANVLLAKTHSRPFVPERATHVDVLAKFGGGDSAFDIQLDEFLRHSRQMNWDLRKLSLSGAFASEELVGYPSHWPQNVKDIYFYSEVNARGSGFRVAYDVSNGRGRILYAQRLWTHHRLDSLHLLALVG